MFFHVAPIAFAVFTSDMYDGSAEMTFPPLIHIAIAVFSRTSVEPGARRIQSSLTPSFCATIATIFFAVVCPYRFPLLAASAIACTAFLLGPHGFSFADNLALMSSKACGAIPYGSASAYVPLYGVMPNAGFENDGMDSDVMRLPVSTALRLSHSRLFWLKFVMVFQLILDVWIDN